MEIKDMLEVLEKSDEYQSWDRNDFFLAHVFKMLDEANKDNWQVGYYSPSAKNMVSFIVDGASVQTTPESEVFKKPDSEISELNLEEIDLDWEEALDKAKAFMAEEYPQEMTITTFFILQKLLIGTVYNITFLTKSFYTINLKISAHDGSVLKHSKESLMDMAKFEKGEGGRETK